MPSLPSLSIVNTGMVIIIMKFGVIRQAFGQKYMNIVGDSQRTLTVSQYT